MTASALVQVRIDPALKERASTVLDKMGLTVSDAVRILLTRIANEGALPFDFAIDPATHDAWFRARVREALEDLRPAIAADDVEAHFAKRRAATAASALEEDGETTAHTETRKRKS
ncbi:DNA-damage-inducible protein J [Paraburkholderia bannensis]|uniref:DNA-damage-inducible protein J n=1 Tax=Paraburkholderia bannensis TaxID=765414 RepID=A0A7W9TYY3_9BURK|nr:MULTISPECIES: type II toxin-antitoxin system RelB/DinJ family antitoxin [Paraburkholderia]MBB3258929.1 DNA-damage-inducible protein J [Paraburkholderia sp. WP4_3_2]MBB6103943.1 DNA-damage-inducible protein J [Paraburkholderia bannensis]